MEFEIALKTIGDWISKETESRKYPKGELLELSESLQALNTEIARQSVKSEDVQREINRLTDALKQTKEAAKELKEQKYAVNMLPVYNQIKSLELQITALQAYQPWIPCSERMPTAEDADCNDEVLVWSSVLEEWQVEKLNTALRYSDDDYTHWSRLPERPKEV